MIGRFGWKALRSPAPPEPFTPVTLTRSVLGRRPGTKAREATRRAYATGKIAPKPSQAAIQRGNAFLAPKGGDDG